MTSANNQAEQTVAIYVTVEIKTDRIDDFMEAMAFNTLESRKEPGCLRFDLLKSSEKENTYHFYEIYTNAAGLAAHRETPAYKKWAAFKESGGVVSQSVSKANGLLLQ
ncbi:unnamed protein product [Amoebophrya sp. A25]|nr:unnamed protein product [Amoebophrya sp. A25]|eukprot:GSA25T00002303001.1